MHTYIQDTHKAHAYKHTCMQAHTHKTYTCKYTFTQDTYMQTYAQDTHSCKHTYMQMGVQAQIHMWTSTCKHTQTRNCFLPLRTRSWGRPGQWRNRLLLRLTSLPPKAHFPPPKMEVVSNCTQRLTEKGSAPSWPNYRGHPGSGPASPALLCSPAIHFPVCPGVSGQPVSRTWCPLRLNYLAGPWPLKWLQRLLGGYFSLTCHHLFSWAPGLWPDIFN